MHASATSRLSSLPVNPQASQPNDANRADQDSPFALLMAASAPKEDGPAREQNDVETPANDQPVASAQPTKPQARTESKPKAKPEEKSKPDEMADNDGQDKQDEVANDNSAPVPAIESNPVATNPVPSQPVVPLIVIADNAQSPAPETPAQESAPAAAAAAAQPMQDLAVLTAAQTANDTALQTKPTGATAGAAQTQAAPQSQPQQTAASQVPVVQTPTPQMPTAQASAPQPAISGTPQETHDPQPAAPQPIVQPAVEQQTNTALSAQPAKETLVQIATLQNPTSTKRAESGEQTGTAAAASTDLRTDTVKPVTHEIPAQHTENVKADAPRPEVVKTDSTKPDMTQPVTVDAAKSAPQIQTPPSTSIGAAHANAVLQPQTAMPGALPGIPQHVQVSAQAPAPNMPALAVEIAAKSQSGAKQFDIRLDPPELGRVEVRLSIDAAGKASAHLSADQPQTLDLLQKDSSSLTRALREAGLNVSQDGLNFSLRQQNQDGGTAQQGQGRHASRGVNLIATNSIEATQNSATWRGDGRLDIRV